MAVHEIDLGKVQGASHAYNLLDNSYFEIAAAGISGYHGANKYAVDRWLMHDSCTASVADGVLSFSATAANTGVQQRIDVGRIKSGQTYTLAFDSWETGTLNVYIEALNNNWGQIAGEGIVVEESDWTAHAVTITVPDTESVIMFRVCFYLQSSGTAAHIRSVRLCEGSYTAETCPAYIPKGYAAELAECQRYWRSFHILFGTDVGSTQRQLFNYGPMRTNPTATIEIVASGSSNSAAYTVNHCYAHYMDVTTTSWGNLKIGLSADL